MVDGKLLSVDPSHQSWAHNFKFHHYHIPPTMSFSRPVTPSTMDTSTHHPTSSPPLSPWTADASESGNVSPRSVFSLDERHFPFATLQRVYSFDEWDEAMPKTTRPSPRFFTFDEWRDDEEEDKEEEDIDSIVEIGMVEEQTTTIRNDTTNQQVISRKTVLVHHRRMEEFKSSLLSPLETTQSTASCSSIRSETYYCEGIHRESDPDPENDEEDETMLSVVENDDNMNDHDAKNNDLDEFIVVEIKSEDITLDDVVEEAVVFWPIGMQIEVPTTTAWDDDMSSICDSVREAPQHVLILLEKQQQQRRQSLFRQRMQVRLEKLAGLAPWNCATKNRPCEV